MSRNLFRANTQRDRHGHSDNHRQTQTHFFFGSNDREFLRSCAIDCFFDWTTKVKRITYPCVGEPILKITWFYRGRTRSLSLPAKMSHPLVHWRSLSRYPPPHPPLSPPPKRKRSLPTPSDVTVPSLETFGWIPRVELSRRSSCARATPLPERFRRLFVVPI